MLLKTLMCYVICIVTSTITITLLHGHDVGAEEWPQMLIFEWYDIFLNNRFCDSSMTRNGQFLPAFKT